MSRYIDADALIKELSTMYKEPTSTEDFMTVGYDKAVADVVVTAHRQPTADVRENVKAHWITMSDADGVYYACSVCGEDIPRVSHFDPQFDLFPRLESIDKTYFCPNCGARMEKEKE